MIVQVPLVVLGISLAREIVGVQGTEVDVVLLTIVPLTLPNLYVSVCVNEDDALLIEIVDALPISTDVAVTDDALGIVGSVCVPLADAFTA